MVTRVIISAIASMALCMSALAQPGIGPGQVLDELWSPKIAAQILAGSAVVTAVINMIWFLVSSTLQRTQYWWNAKSMVYPVAFTRGMTKANYNALSELIEGFSCLHVRFGADQYLSTLASDQERREGRLQNKVLPVEVQFDTAGNAILTLRLPIHKRIGTQFKCFVTVRREDTLSAVQEFLKNCDRIKGVSASRSIRSNRVYFLLDRFHEVATIDSHTNNMVYPE